MSAAQDRTFEFIGANCVRCSRDCGNIDATNSDHHAFGMSLEVNGIQKPLVLCAASPIRGSEQPITLNKYLHDCRVCLLKQPKFDPTATIEVK